MNQDLFDKGLKTRRELLGAVHKGLSKDAIREVFLQAAIHCGVSAAIDSFRPAKETSMELGI